MQVFGLPSVSLAGMCWEIAGFSAILIIYSLFFFVTVDGLSLLAYLPIFSVWFVPSTSEKLNNYRILLFHRFDILFCLISTQ